MMDDLDAQFTRDDDAAPDPVLDALLRRHDPARRRVPSAHLEARVLDAATFALAARRRDARTTMADTLATWVRIALPLAAAAAIAASIYVPRLEQVGTVAEVELRESDPGALLSALESEGSSGLANHLIVSDALPATTESDAR